MLVWACVYMSRNVWDVFVVCVCVCVCVRECVRACVHACVCVEQSSQQRNVST